MRVKLFGCLECLQKHGLTTSLTRNIGTGNAKKCGLCGKRFQEIPTDRAWLLKTIGTLADAAAKDGCNTTGSSGHVPYHEYGVIFNPAGRRVGCKCTNRAYEFLENVLMLLTEPRKLKVFIHQK